MFIPTLNMISVLPKKKVKKEKLEKIRLLWNNLIASQNKTDLSECKTVQQIQDKCTISRVIQRLLVIQKIRKYNPGWEQIQIC